MSIENEGVVGVDIMQDPDTKKSIEEYALNNRVKANDKRRVCGDDRFEGEESNGAERIFGGDEGALTAVVGALNKAEIEVDADDLVARYEKALKEIYGEDTVLEAHTDKEAAEKGEMGCGFMKHAINDHGLHEFLSTSDARQIHEAIIAREHKETVLEGKHKAQSVLLVHSSEWSVNSKDSNSQHFVVDVDRAVSFFQKIVPMLGIYGLQTTDVISQFESQMDKTARILARDLPVYDLQFDFNGVPHAEFNSIVPHPEPLN